MRSNESFWRRDRNGLRIACLVLAASLLGGCGEAAEPEPEVLEQRYPLAGEVVSVNAERETVVIAHEEIEGFMNAMTMPFNVRDAWVFEAAKPGSRVTADLVVQDASSWLENIVVTGPAGEGAAAEGVIPAADPGDIVPAFTVTNQDEAERDSDAYRGRYLLFTFIYTRCPLPDFCPRMSENFDRIHDAIEQDPARFGDAHLLSISVDPAYDTPAILRLYGQRYLEDGEFARWEFARMEPEPLRQLAEFTGIRFRPDQGEIIHSLRTVVVDPDGRVVKVYVGNSWSPEELLEELVSSVASGAEVLS